MRSELKKSIIREIDKCNYILLTGDHGIGKSFLAFIAIASKYIYRGSGDYEMGTIIAF